MDDKVIEKDESKSKTEDESSSDESLNLDLELKCETCNKTFTSFKCLVQHEKSRKHYKKLSQKKLMEKKVNENLEDESEISDLMLYPKPYAGCDTCQKEFSGPESFHQHLKSKVHHKKVEKAKLLEQVTEDGKIDEEKLKLIYKHQKKTPQETFGASAYSPTLEETESYDNAIAESHQFECFDCEKVFTGVDPWFQHLVSKTHEKTLKQKKLLDKVTAGPSSKNSSASVSGVASSSSRDLEDAIEVDEDVLVCRLCHKSFSGPESAAAHMKSRGHAKNVGAKEWKIQHSAALKTQKTKAQEQICENQSPAVSASITAFQGNKPMSSSEIEGKDVDNLTEKEDSELKEKSGEDLTSPVSAPSDAACETEKVSKTEKENVLLRYESYKNYKKIMNEIEEENNCEKKQ